jgi:cell surface protein SprA
VVSGGLMFLITGSDAKVGRYNHAANADSDPAPLAIDTPETEDIDLPYDFQDQSTGDPLNYPNGGGLLLDDPSNITTNVEYDPTTGQYIITQTMGGINYRPPTYMDAEEYQAYMFNKQKRSYWNQRVHAESANKQNAVIPPLRVGGEIFDRIFGGNQVDIRPNGSAELIFAYNGTKTKNPALPEKQQKVSTFDFNEKIQLNVVGKIGDKLKLTTSYNTEATFDFENQMKLEYTGYEDEIIKKIEAGNVSLPLNGSLITGSQTLFGVKTQLQFGRLTVTSILSQQKGKKSEVEVTGGAQVSKFVIEGENYEERKHYFLGQYFRDNYDLALQSPPFVNSGVNITKIEVWVSNTNSATNDVREVLAFTELGEDDTHIPPDVEGSLIQDVQGDKFPYNAQNTLFSNIVANTAVRTPSTAVNAVQALEPDMKQNLNFERIAARKLQPSEYTYNAKLGYISLSQTLNTEQAIGVAFQYTLNGQSYQVGELSTDGIGTSQLLYVKMLKSSNTSPTYFSNFHGARVQSELWNLMMKNIYSIGSYQINPNDFRLNVFYNNQGVDINFIPIDNCPGVSSVPLIQVLNVDKLNPQNDPSPDGVFDFLDGITINANNGRLIFPVVEPFGSHLESKLACPGGEPFVYNQLYDSIKATAINQFPTRRKFRIKGQYESSSSSEISLGAPNVPQGSVTVTAGGVQLTENVDYTVDYTLGRVKIVNEGILNSGTPIKISLESNALFAIQSKTLFGTHLDFRVNKDFNIGATVMRLTERPLTQKVNIGDEPISNTIWGIDANYRTEAPFLTRLVDRIPLIETKEMSTITAAGEFAYLVPGHSKAIGKDGNSYIDDFEGSQSTIDLRSQASWQIAATPQEQPDLFPEGSYSDTVAYGLNRAKLAWYVIDPLFMVDGGQSNVTPTNIDPNMRSNHFMRQILETEVFPNKQNQPGQTNIATLDMAYYPSERGPYNYDVLPTSVSAGLAADGGLNSPASRWAGITRSVQTNDFESANIEYIQFWVMDPFNSDNPATDWNTTGDLYFNIGNISEDVLRDGFKSAENILPAPSTADQNGGLGLPYVVTDWGNIPTSPVLVNAFNSEPNDRPFQDVGLDGLSSVNELSFFANYLSSVLANVGPAAHAVVSGDPSADDFHYFRGDDYDPDNAPPTLNTLQRYKKWNGLEGNSEAAPAGQTYSKAATQIPNTEDVNRDNNLSTVESYYQYRVSLKKADFDAGVGNNFITDVFSTTGQQIENGQTKPIKWYQFKIPLKGSDRQSFGNIENFQSIRFIRMFFKNVDKPIILRFARLELVRGEWRKYGFDITAPGLYIPDDDANTQFDIGAVNIEENGNKTPVNYVLPPDIQREQNAASASLVALNEQSMSLTVCNLEDGKAKAAYKTTQLDVRQYKKLKMYIHCEASANTAEILNGNDLHVFIRLGSDFTDNYYEYDIPLQVTAPGNYNGTNTDDQYRVWPEANEMVLEFERLQSAKQKRNLAMINGVGGISLTSEFTSPDGSRMITIKGNPNLSDIRTIMIGVRNPKKNSSNDNDDGMSKCGQIWVNELRLTDFDQKGGWAANARVTAKLADFGSVSLSGNMYTPGFGSLENKVNERRRETLKQYDLSSSLELGKFIPEKYNVHIPMYVGYSETFITPQYNPLDPDILLAPVLNDESIPEEAREKLKHQTQDYTRRKGINFSNVKKDKGKNASKSMPYDVENFAVSYAYNELYKRSVNVEYNMMKNHRGGLLYNYAPKQKNIKPFAKTKAFQSKYLALIKDINFYPYPNKFSFKTDVDREYNVMLNRNITGENLLILPTYNKRFNMFREYALSYDITKGIKLDFNANNEERILEQEGEVTAETKKQLRDDFFDLIKKTKYNQQTSLSYVIPINKIPLLDFTTASVKYSGTYRWTRGPISADSLGNVIDNSKGVQWTAQGNMTTLYNKIPYFKKINQKSAGNKNKGKTSAIKTPQKTPADTTKKKEDNFEILEYVARLVMSVKTVSVSYVTTEGTQLPGYGQGTQILGLDEHFEGPTAGFVFGSQKQIIGKAVENDWLVKTASLNNPYIRSSSEKFDVRANVEPFPDLKIEITMNRTRSSTKNQLFRWDPVNQEFNFDAQPTEFGNFSMSYMSYQTSFVKNGELTFNKFLDARASISARLGDENQNSTTSINGFAEGYNELSQDVMIPAFLAAYADKNPNGVSLSAFPTVPKPNWRITYDGLAKLEKVKKYFKSFTLSNAYRSTYNVGQYNNNLFWEDDGSGYTAVKEAVSTITANPNFLSKHQITTVTISEQWSPLVKLDVTLNNSVTVNLEYKKDRNISLGLTSQTITEAGGREIVGGIGYRIKDVSLGKNMQIKGKPIKSDLNLKVDLSFRKNETVIRRIVEKVSQSTGGTNVISIKVSADYIINERINIKAFYDRIINKPVISSSFPTTNTNAGISLRLTLSN